MNNAVEHDLEEQEAPILGRGESIELGEDATD